MTEETRLWFAWKQAEFEEQTGITLETHSEDNYKAEFDKYVLGEEEK